MRKTLLVTGGSSGIGLACVLRFLESGWNVCFSFLSGSDMAQDICRRFDTAFAVKCDCSNSNEVNALVEQCVARFHGIDAVISSAGITSQNQIQDITDDELHKIFDVNFFGTFYTFRATTPYFLEKKQGRLVAISSVFSHSGGSCETHYSASKAAINGLVTSLSSELAPSGITVNAIAPGIVDTPMNDAHTLGELIKYTPQKRLCTPSEVAATAFFLCSESSRFITGQVLRQDGGVEF